MQHGRERQRSNLVRRDQPSKQTADEVAKVLSNQHQEGEQDQQHTAAEDSSLDARKVRNSAARDIVAGDIAPAISGTVPSAVAVAQQ